MMELDPSHHIFRHIKKSWMDGEFVEPSAFRLRKDDGTGQFEDGLSVNWAEHFRKSTAQEAIAPLRDILEKKGRKIGGESKFALLNVSAAKTAAAKYAVVSIATDDDPQDPSHAQVTGYEAYNQEVAEELAKVVITTYPAKS